MIGQGDTSRALFGTMKHTDWTGLDVEDKGTMQVENHLLLFNGLQYLHRSFTASQKKNYTAQLLNELNLQPIWSLQSDVQLCSRELAVSDNTLPNQGGTSRTLTHVCSRGLCCQDFYS